MHPTLTELTGAEKPGFYKIDHEPYHNGPGLSSSDLKNALVSYGHFLHKKEADEDPTPAMEFGRAFHMAILEPELFRERYQVMPEFTGLTKDGRESKQSGEARAKREAWLAERPGVDVISAENKELLDSLAASVRAHDKWSLLRGLSSEVMGCVKDPETGFFLKCKADMLGAAIVDFKTTMCAAPWAARQAVDRYNYHVSAAFYQDVCFAVDGLRRPFVFVFVEKKAPYGVSFCTLSDEYLAEGRKLYKAALGRIAKWERMPVEQRRMHYGPSIHVLTPTSGAMYKTMDLMKAMETV